MKRKKSKSKKVYILRIVLVIAVAFGFIWYFNNLTLKNTYVKIYSEKINSSISIAVISDLHYDRICISTDKIYSRIARENPDLVFVLGDMYSGDSVQSDIDETADFIISLGDICPVYFVSGEHDNDADFLKKLRQNDVNVMDYKYQKIWVDGNQLEIYGIDNVYFSDTFNLKNEFQSPDKNVYSILLAHIPMYKYYQNFGTDLTVCGDTHGGIMQLPFVGCIRYEGEWFPEMHRSSDDVYDKGLFSYIGGYMFITSGLGNYPFPVRLNNRPEIAFINLMPVK
jgi:hypothetical protein